jgi:hypothetical protein
MVHGVKKENKGPLSEATSISTKLRDLSSVFILPPRHRSEQKAFLTLSSQIQSVPNTDTTSLSFHT